MTTPSRHDRFPRFDVARRGRMRTAASAVEARWRAEDARPGGLAAAIDAVAGAGPAAVIAAFDPWLADLDWLRGRLDAALALLVADPFARPPLRPVGGGEGPGGLIFAERGSVRLSLQLHPAGAAAPGTVLFVPGRSAFRVLAAGGAMVGYHHVDVTAREEAGGFTAAGAARCLSAPRRPLAVGERWDLDTARTAFTLSGATSDVLLLELAVQPPSRLPIRSYATADGRLLHASASRRDGSFRQMALALLRTFARVDAAPLFAAETRADDFAARWSAMREFVALAPEAARPHLAQMAAIDPHPEIRRAAAATLALYRPPPACGEGIDPRPGDIRCRA
jgi:hypothetical protein